MISCVLGPRCCVTLASLCALCSLCDGCGGAAELPREQRLNEAFAQIQVHEARIENQLAKIERGVTCDEACAARAQIAQEREHICGIASDVADADALARCDQAGAALDSTRATKTRCECAKPVPCNHDCSSTSAPNRRRSQGARRRNGGAPFEERNAASGVEGVSRSMRNHG